MMTSLTPLQFLILIVLYGVTIFSLSLMLWIWVQEPRWKWMVYLFFLSAVMCALGWEVWWNFALVDGLPVDKRRPPDMNKLLPISIIWLINSIGDGFICFVAVMFIIWRYNNSSSDIIRASWDSGHRRCFRIVDFIVTAVWFVGQDIIMSTFVLKDQLKHPEELSVAPFSPVHATWNPINIGSISIDVQLPLIFMSLLWYPLMLSIFHRLAPEFSNINVPKTHQQSSTLYPATPVLLVH